MTNSSLIVNLLGTLLCLQVIVCCVQMFLPPHARDVIHPNWNWKVELFAKTLTILRNLNSGNRFLNKNRFSIPIPTKHKAFLINSNVEYLVVFVVVTDCQALWDRQMIKHFVKTDHLLWKRYKLKEVCQKEKSKCKVRLFF